MSIDDQLRAALGWEAEMQEPSTPDLERLISGGRARRRRRNLARAGVVACESEAPSMEVGETSQALARQLAVLPRSTVIKAPTPARKFGHDAVHLRLRIDDQCHPGSGYRVAETSRGSRGITYRDIDQEVDREVVIDFWVVEVHGIPVVIDSWHQADAPRALVHRIAQTRDSIAFVGAE